MKKLTLCLDLAGILLLSAFAFVIWAPLALLALGCAALLASWRLAS